MHIIYKIPASSVTSESPVWSIGWSQAHAHHVFAGCQNGRVYMYDLRMNTLNEANLTRPLCDVTQAANNVPVTSIAYVQNAVNENGLVVF